MPEESAERREGDALLQEVDRQRVAQAVGALKRNPQAAPAGPGLEGLGDGPGRAEVADEDAPHALGQRQRERDAVLVGRHLEHARPPGDRIQGQRDDLAGPEAVGRDQKKIV
jgi:hypothetical protein